MAESENPADPPLPFTREQLEYLQTNFRPPSRPEAREEAEARDRSPVRQETLATG